MPEFPRNQAAPLLSTDILDRTRPQAIANGLLVIGETEDDMIFARYSPNRPHLVEFFPFRRQFMNSDILVVTQVHTFMRPLCFLQLTNGLPNQNLVAHVSSLVLWYLRYAGFRPGQNGQPVAMDHFSALGYILCNPEFLAWWYQDNNMARRVGDDLAADRRGTQRLELPAQGRELVREARQVHGQRIGQDMNPHRYLAQQAQRAQLAQRAVRAQRVQQVIQQAQQQQRAARGPTVQNPVAPRANNAAGAHQPGGERRPVANGQAMQVYNGPVPPSPFHTANVARGLHPGAGRNLHIDRRNDVNSQNAILVGRDGNPIDRRDNVNVQNAAVLGGRSNPIDLCGDDDVQNAPVAETAGVRAQPERIFSLAFPLVKTKADAERAAELAAEWAASKRATARAFELFRKRLAGHAAGHLTESVVESVYESIAQSKSTSTSRPLPAVRPNPTSYRSKRAIRVRKLKASGKSTIGFIYRINKGLQRTALKAQKRKLAAQEQSEKNLDPLSKGVISAANGDIQVPNNPRHGSVSSEVSVVDLLTDSSTHSSPMTTTSQVPVPSAQLDDSQVSTNLRVEGNGDDEDPDELYTEPTSRPSATATASEAPAPSSPPAQNGNRPDPDDLPDVAPRAQSHAEQVAAARLNGSTDEDIEAAEILLSLGKGPVVFRY